MLQTFEFRFQQHLATPILDGWAFLARFGLGNYLQILLTETTLFVLSNNLEQHLLEASGSIVPIFASSQSMVI